MYLAGLSPMRLVSYVKNPIRYGMSDGRAHITVDAVGKLKAALKGKGVVYSWFQGVGRYAALNCQFDLQQMTQAEYLSEEQGRISIELDAQPRSSCSGIRTSTGEGYIIGPAFILDPIEGQDIVLLILAPRTTPYNVEVEKSVLVISKDESEVTVTSDGGELRCSGAISGQTRTAQIVLIRNPELPVYRAGFDQTLSELRGQGQISATWRPVAQSFEELVLAFHSSSMGSNIRDLALLDLDAIANLLGAPGFGDPGEFDDYVIGDGPGVNYALRLRIDRGLGRHDSDETKITVT